VEEVGETDSLWHQLTGTLGREEETTRSRPARNLSSNGPGEREERRRGVGLLNTCKDGGKDELGAVGQLAVVYSPKLVMGRWVGKRPSGKTEEQWEKTQIRLLGMA